MSRHSLDFLRILSRFSVNPMRALPLRAVACIGPHATSRFSGLMNRAVRLALLLGMVCLLPAMLRAAPVVQPESPLQVGAAILYDLDKDRILFEQNADTRIPPASLTKVLSMFLALDYVTAGYAQFDSTVPVSRLAARTGGSRMGLKEREAVRLEDLLLGMAVSSGNDASAAVAEFVGGSTSDFVLMMNAKARALGMRDSRFNNPHGLPSKGQYTTARDMLMLARGYLRSYPWALRFHNTHVLNHNGNVTWNRNPLLGNYPGGDGLKTGWVNASGYNLIFTAGRGSTRLLAVILGAPDVKARAAEAFRLLDAGFLADEKQVDSVTTALGNLPVENYRPDLKKIAHKAGRQYAQAKPASKQYKKAAGKRGSKQVKGRAKGRKAAPATVDDGARSRAAKQQNGKNRARAS